MKKRRWLKIAIGFLVVMILAEIALRIFLDNEHRVVYQEDEFCEYRLVPDQNTTRFHNTYQTNKYGMRSPDLKNSQKKRVLLFGDSVLNGGTKIDQKDLVNYILEDELSKKLGVEVGVYNSSAGSWGPENAYRFMEHYVDFEFDLLVLVFGSHDYHDNMHFRKVVGKEPAWPDDQPWLALTDLYAGYISPKIRDLFGTKYDYLEGFDDAAVNPGWELFFEYARVHKKQILVYHHADTAELKEGAYSEEGKLLDTLLVKNNVPVIDGLAVEKEEDYLDNIHVKAAGHTKMAQALLEKIIGDQLLEPLMNTTEQ